MIKRYSIKLSKWVVSLALLSGATGAALFTWVVLTSPNVDIIKGCFNAQISNVEVCEKNVNYVPLNAIAPKLIESIVYSEDAKFYEHSGFDFGEIFNSAKLNLKKMSLYRGGSTITQQFVKNAFLTKEKTIIRKLTEAYLTFHVESLLSKNQILEKYLNMIEFGPNVYGIRSAATHYFDKEPHELNVLESAFLAYLLPNPRLYSKIFHTGELTEYAEWRLEGVLKSLKLHRKITTSQFQAARERIKDFPRFSDFVLPLPLESDDEEFLEASSPLEDRTPSEPVAIDALEPGQFITSIGEIRSGSAKLGYIEVHLNSDTTKDLLIFDLAEIERENAKSYVFIGSGDDSYSFVGTIWLNPKQFLIEEPKADRYSTIYTFIPNDPVNGDLVKYRYQGGEYLTDAQEMNQEEAEELFLDYDYDIQEI